MQNKVCLPKVVVCQKVVEERNDAVCILPYVLTLIYEVVDLYSIKLMGY